VNIRSKGKNKTLGRESRVLSKATTMVWLGLGRLATAVIIKTSSKTIGVEQSGEVS